MKWAIILRCAGSPTASKENNNMNTTTENEVIAFCEKHDACSECLRFAEKYATMAEVWDACERVDWLVWIYRRTVTPMDLRELRLFACWCVRETPLADGRKVWDLLTDERSRNAVVVAERFVRGEATGEELERARSAASAADAADATYATYAAAAYANAAYAAAADADAANANAAYAAATNAAYAAYAAAADADAANAAAAYADARRKQAAKLLELIAAAPQAAE